MAGNTWPGGVRRALDQSMHERWNASNHPGTRQECSKCGDSTDRCENDAIYTESGEGPLCVKCYRATDNYQP